MRSLRGMGIAVWTMLAMLVPWQGLANPDSAWETTVAPWQAARRSAAAAGQVPTEAIKELERMLGSYRTGADLTPVQVEENRQLKQKILHGTFDIRELSRIALGRHWIDLPDAERDRFVQLMIDLLEEKALLSKEQAQTRVKKGGVYSVQYRGDRYLDKIKQRALTRTQVYVPSHNVRVALDYKLRRNSSQWKIYDVVVDGSSLVENYQYQFDNIITKHGYPELIRRMEKRLTELREEKGKPSSPAPGEAK